MVHHTVMQRAPMVGRARVVTVRGAGFGSKPALKAAGQTCPCGSKKVYKECCEPFILKKAVASTAEEVVRARFSSFAKGKTDFLLASDSRPEEAEGQRKRDVAFTSKNYVYSALKVLSSDAGPDGSTVVQLSYKSKMEPKGKNALAGYRDPTAAAAPPVEKNVDGTTRVFTVVENVTLQPAPGGGWAVSAVDQVSCE